MQTTPRSGLLVLSLILGSLVSLPFTVTRADDAPKAAPPAAEKPAATPATAPSTQRSREAIMTDLNDAGKAMRAAIPSLEALGDAKKREEMAPKAIPAMKKFLSTFDELTAQDPMAKAQSAQVHAQFLSMMTALGDADAEKQLNQLAQGGGDEALECKMAVILAKWWKNSTNAAGQKPLLDDARALLKDNPKSDSVAMTIMQMSEQGAASPEIKEAAQTIVVEGAKGPRATMLIAGIQANQKLKSLEGKELTLAGVTQDGKQFTTADWKGKVILVDFWATWCAPCRAELPRVKKAYADNHAKGLEIIGVSCDREPAALAAFLKENPDMPWPQLFDAKMPGWHPLATQYGVEGIPTMFLIDKKGIVRSVSARENFEEVIPKMLDEK